MLGSTTRSTPARFSSKAILELRRQPGGFEAVRLAFMGADADGLALAPADDMPHDLIDGSPALAAVTARPQARNRRVVHSAHLQRFRVPDYGPAIGRTRETALVSQN